MLPEIFIFLQQNFRGINQIFSKITETPNMQQRKIFLVIIFIFISFFSFSQRTLRFQNISLESGLSQTTVQSILQDSRGFIWMGTLDGLNFYDGYNITIIRNDPSNPNSIPDNSINGLFEDKAGNLWVAIYKKGLARYNAVNKSFVSYMNNKINPNSMVDNNITCITQDHTGALWVGSDKGISSANVIEEDDGNVKLIFNNLNNDPVFLQDKGGEIVTKIIYDKRKLLWIGTEQGLIVYDMNQKKFYKFRNDPEIPHTISSNKITALFLDQQGNVWVGTDKGLNKILIKDIKLNSNNRLIFKHYYNEPGNENSISSNKINSISQDREGNIWIGTDNGLNIYELQSNNFFSYKNNYLDKYSLKVNKVICVYHDRENTMWVGTSLGGVDKWHKYSKEFNLYQNNPFISYSISSNLIRSFHEDLDGDIWVGTVDGGINRWSKIDNTFKYFKADPKDINSLSNNHIRSILEDSRRNFWVGTEGGGLNMMNKNTGKCISFKNNENDPKSIPNNRIWYLYEDTKDNVWVGTFGGGLCRFKNNSVSDGKINFEVINKEKNGLSDNFISNITEDITGKLWIATYYGGLNQWIESEKRCKAYSFSYKTEEYDRVYSILVAKDGTLWLGARGSLRQFDPVKEKYLRYFDMSCGIPNQVIMGVLEDLEENLWFSSNSGISKFNVKEGKVSYTFTHRDGLQGSEFMIGAFYKTSQSEMLFGGVNGFNSFYAGRIRENVMKPPVVITNFLVNNQEMLLDSAITDKKEVHLSYLDKTFTIEFAVLDYLYSGNIQYAYKMEGFDKDWNLVKNRRFANFTNLPHGTYTFKVKGSNSDGIWNQEGATLKIIIHPPFYKTTWFIALMIILVVAMVIGAIKLRDLFRDKGKLQVLVEQRTQQLQQRNNEILEKNEELKQQQEEITTSMEEVERHRDLLEEAHTSITSSIKYAQRIQRAILTPPEVLDSFLQDYFIFYMPRDIVSGDYYWFSHVKNQIIAVAADCTGHGVPGAFLSMLGVSFLNEIANKMEELNAAEILNQLRANIVKALHQTGKSGENKDGMDISLIVINPEEHKLQFAGAHNSLYMVIKDEMHVVKADPMPVGIYERDQEFTNHVISYKPGYVAYLASDGFPDQFGGPEGKKFMYRQFRELLVKIHKKPMKEQKNILHETFENWQGNEMQIDDVLVIGIRL